MPQKRIYRWITSGSLALGFGFWATHFIGMLAYRLPIKLYYDIPTSALSILLVTLTSWMGLFLIRNGLNTMTKLYSGSLFIGSGILGMHFLETYSMKINPPEEYKTIYIFLAVLWALFGTATALRLSLYGKKPPFLFLRKNTAGAIALGLSICGAHYLSMAGITLAPDSISNAKAGGITEEFLTLLVFFTSFVIISLCLAFVFFEMRMAEQNALMVHDLLANNQQLQKKSESITKSMTEKIRQSGENNRLLADIVKQSPDAIITTDQDGLILSWNAAAASTFGYDEKEMIGKPFLSLKNLSENDRKLTEEYSDPHTTPYLFYKSKEGNLVYIHELSSPIINDDGEKTGQLFILKDVSRIRDIHRMKILQSAVFHGLGEAVMITNRENKIITVNDSFTRITGYPLEEVAGKKPSVLSSGRHDKSFYETMWANLLESGVWQGEIWNRKKNGSIYPEWLTIKTLKTESGNITNYIGIFSDRSSYKEKEEYIKFLAFHDNLTGLPNRVLMEDRLSLAIAHAHRTSQKVAVLFMDLDRFKNINDSLGHTAGDLLLMETAKRLLGLIRSDDTVARQGGDEFVIILQDIQSPQDVAHIAQKILDAVSEKMTLGSNVMNVSSSIGISLFPDDGETSDHLIRNADTAMYHAKEQGRSNFQFFTERLNEITQKKIELETEMSQASERGEFYLVLQPQVDLKTRKITGAEILLRWNHHKMGEVSPEEFIPIAEESELIATIGDWVMENGFMQLSKLFNENPVTQNMRFSINISPRQLRKSNIVDKLQALMNQYTPPKQTIEIEITETAIMEDLPNNLELINRLKNLGLNLAIDDFGSGYSSLSILRRMPVDRLKIDRSFIREVVTDLNDATIVRAIISLAHTLGLSVIAEGVENVDQEKFLKKAHCNFAQGFYFYPPMTFESFVHFINENQHKPAQ